MGHRGYDPRRKNAAMYAMIALLQGSDAGWKRLLEAIPHDAPAIFVYVLAAGSIYLIWRGSRQRTK